jgi:hypothetical protein
MYNVSLFAAATSLNCYVHLMGDQLGFRCNTEAVVSLITWPALCSSLVVIYNAAMYKLRVVSKCSSKVFKPIIWCPC